MNPVPSWILRDHSTNADSPYQREPEAFRCMVTNHHPFANEYNAARQAFDELPFAAGAGYRYFSAIDESNYSVVSAPAIGFSDGGWPPAHRYLVEAHQDRQTYCWQAVCEATAGWPDREKYFLNHGEWHIFTTDRDVMREAQALGMQVISLPSYHQCRQTYCDAETMAAIAQLVCRYHAGHLLLPRQVPPPLPQWRRSKPCATRSRQARTPGFNAGGRMPRKFTVTVLRTAYAEQDIEIEADDPEEAKQLALDSAGDYSFSEHDYEYDVQAVTEHPAPPAPDPGAAKMPAPPEIPDASDAWL